MRPRRLVALLALAQLLHVAGWGAYYALTRMLYSGQERFLLALAAAETLPTAAGVAGGLLAEARGYRAALGFGLVEAASLTAAGLLVHSPPGLWLTAFIASLAWSIAGPQVYAFTLTATGLGAEELGRVMAGATLGFSIGAGLAPLAAEHLDPGLVLAGFGAAVAASYIIALSVAHGRPLRGPGEGLRGRLGRVALVAATAASAYTGTETLGSVYLGRLSREVGASLYSAANAAAGLIGAAARPLAGRLVDRRGADRVLVVTLLAYSAYTLILDRVHGLLFLVVWLTPLFPFLDTSLYKLAATLLGEALGASVVSSSYSITGAVLLAASLVEAQGAALAVAGFLSAAVLAAASGRAAASRAPVRGVPRRTGRMPR